MSESGPTRDEWIERLKAAESALARCERLAIGSRFTSAMLQEASSPLEALNNLAYLLEVDPPGSPRTHEYVAVLKEQLGILNGVVRTTLTFHPDRAAAEPVDLVMIAQAALKVHFATLATRNVKVRTRFAERAVSHVVAGEILQVFSNLILNAMEAFPGTLTPSLHVRVHRRHHGLHVTVADNGPGIPETIESELFKANVAGRRTGTGMGLWLSKSLVLKHGGRLRFRTWRTSGRSGTVFQAWFPHADAA